MKTTATILTRAFTSSNGVSKIKAVAASGKSITRGFDHGIGLDDNHAAVAQELATMLELGTLETRSSLPPNSKYYSSFTVGL